MPAAIASRIGSGQDATVEAWLEASRRDTSRRLTEGAWDHAIAYALQSPAFTAMAPIEPAVSAQRYANARGTPADARRRLQAFARAVVAAPHQHRWVPVPDAATSDDLLRVLEREYARCMNFLLQQARRGDNGDTVATLYQTRGLSTDTSIEAGYAVHEGLGGALVLRPAKVQRVLVVGPGLEVAPRTGFDGARLGQSYQPVAILDSLRRLGAAHDDISVDVVDVNPAVVQHFSERAGAGRDQALTVGTQLTEGRDGPLTAGFTEYLSGWGAMVGAADVAMRRTNDGRWQGRIDVRREAWQRIHAQEANIALDLPSHAAYDLIVATNVLAYLDETGVRLALHAIRRALLPGGVLLHNDRRTALFTEAGADGLPVQQLRSVTFTQPIAGRPAAYDLVVIHQRATEDP